MGFRETTRKKPEEKGKENHKIDEVFAHIEKRVDARAREIKQHQVISNLPKAKENPFEVNEKAVVLALNLSEALGKGVKALDKW